jgi:hypothetical protein
MPILVGKMDTRRQTFFWAFEQYFGSRVGRRSVPVTLQYSFFGEASGFIQEGCHYLTRGIEMVGVRIRLISILARTKDVPIRNQRLRALLQLLFWWRL